MSFLKTFSAFRYHRFGLLEELLVNFLINIKEFILIYDKGVVHLIQCSLKAVTVIIVKVNIVGRLR